MFSIVSLSKIKSRLNINQLILHKVKFMKNFQLASINNNNIKKKMHKNHKFIYKPNLPDRKLEQDLKQETID